MIFIMQYLFAKCEKRLVRVGLNLLRKRPFSHSEPNCWEAASVELRPASQGYRLPINTGSDHECRARQEARRAASDPRCGAGTWNVCQVCVWLVDHDSSPSKKKPRLRMIRLIPADILCRRLRLFIRAVFWDTASALISERRGSSCDSGVQTAVGCIDVPDAWTGAGG